MVVSGAGFFYHWEGAEKAGAEKAGGKGWNLGRLFKYGFPVPRGGVLSAGAYETFLDTCNLRQEVAAAGSLTLDSVGETGGVEQLARLRGKILAGRLPAGVMAEVTAALEGLGILHGPLAVRSSAVAEDAASASFAGIHESFLNVCGPASVEEAIKGCYASLWTPGAVAYRRKMGVADAQAAMAVVIMEMVHAEAAGVGFTCDPRTGRLDTLVVQANFGLGESVVSGRVDPDTYYLDAQTNMMPRVRHTKLGRKEGRTVPRESGGTEFVAAGVPGGGRSGQVLRDAEITRLGLLLQRVDEALGGGGAPQDVEWACDGREFHLLQARPVTSLPRYTYPVLQGQPDLWSNANIKDSIPMVLSTLERKLVAKLFHAIYTAPFKAAGYPALPGLQYTMFHQGRMYLNAALMQWEFYDAFGMTPRETNQAAGGYQPEIRLPEGLEPRGAALARNWRKLKLGAVLVREQKKAGRKFAMVRDYTRRWLERDLRDLGGMELIAAIEEVSRFSVGYAPTAGLLNASQALPFNTLTGMLEKEFPGQGNALANAVLQGAGRITSAEQGYRLVQLAEIAREDPAAVSFFRGEPFAPGRWAEKLPDGSAFERAFRSFLEEFGHRAVYEGDIANPRWREDPSYLLHVVRSLLDGADYAQMKARQAERREAAWRQIKDRVPFHRRRAIKWSTGQAVKGAEMREMAKSELVRLAEPMRLLAKEIGGRLVERGILVNRDDVYHCAWPELLAILAGHWDGRGLRVLVAERRENKKRLEALTPPDVIVGETPRCTAAASAVSASGTAFTGIGVAAGRGTGVARLIYHPGEGGRLQPGEVLVAPSTDPGWAPLFLKARALVMETGGFMSHGAIVAREFGIPAVANVPGLMAVVQDGREITVDGDEGKVYL